MLEATAEVESPAPSRPPRPALLPRSWLWNGLLARLLGAAKVLPTFRQHFLAMTIHATSKSSQQVNKLAPIKRLRVPPTSQSKSMVPYPTSSLMYSNSKFWKERKKSKGWMDIMDRVNLSGWWYTTFFFPFWKCILFTLVGLQGVWHWNGGN